MPNAKTTACKAILVFMFGTAQCVQARAVDEFLIGAWARSQPECTRPELTFGKTTLDIAIDADGQLISFAFPDIRYQQNAQQIAVNLGSPHPYSKTPEKKSLVFSRINHNTIALQKRKGGDTRFIRCSSV